MLFTELVKFEDALKSRKVKAILPTTLSSAELSEIATEIKERAMFSARTSNAGYLQKIDDVIGTILEPTTEEGRTVGMNPATARLEMKQALEAIGYKAPTGKEGTITDLSSDARLNLVIDTNLRMAHGYGYWQEGQAVIDEFPAYELFRGEDRNEPRDWPERWRDAGGEFYAGDSDYPAGRMIALKNDPIWSRLSAFGLPYPPFDYSSGMDVRDVDRQESIDLGLIEKDDRMAPEDRGFNEDLKVSAKDMEPRLREQLMRDVGDRFEMRGGVLQAK